MKRSFTLIVMFIALCSTSVLAQKTQKQDPWKQAGADDSLQRAFEKAIYTLKDSSHGSWSGTNDAQKLSMEWNAQGVHLTHPEGSVGFHLSGYGYGERLKTPAAPKLAGDGTRLEYRRGDFTEWYVNGRQGLEQGFTLAQKPAGISKGQPLTITLGVTGTLALSEQDGAVLLKSGKSTVLRYGGLSARDALGRAIPAHMEASNNEIRLEVEDQKAQYPLTVDPTWSVDQELIASDGVAYDQFGTSVAISGTTAVIGGTFFYDVPGGTFDQGKAYVFVQSGNTWTMQQELTASDLTHDSGFGCSVAVSGKTVLVGACGGNAVYVFVQSGSTWTEQQKLTASDVGIDDDFGGAVAVSGTTIIVGDSGHDGTGDRFQGAAYIFEQSGTTWSQQQELTASDGADSDGFGGSVAMSGTIALIGAPGRDIEQGAAYVFEQSGTTWKQQQELTAPDGASLDEFGLSIAVSGTIAVIGAPFADTNGTYSQGKAYVFVQSGNTWTQQQELISSDGVGADEFGLSVGVSGTTAIIGAPGMEWLGIPEQSQGKAYVFVQSGNTWTQQQELTASDGVSGDEFGSSVAMSGTTAVVGAPEHQIGTNSAQGAAYVLATGSAQPATFITPIPGSTFAATSVDFTWLAAAGVPFYDLHLSAIGAGGSDVYSSGIVESTSVKVTGVPANGATIYARLYSLINGGWEYTDTTFTELGPAQLTSPGRGTTLTGSALEFTWTPVTPVPSYDLHLSTIGWGGSDVYSSGLVGSTSINVTGIPVNGAKIYARLYSWFNGAWEHTDSTYTAATLAQLTSPTPGSTLTGSSVTFTWSAVAGVPLYDLHLSAIGPGGSDLYSSGGVEGTSVSVFGLPTNGKKIYARLYSLVYGTFESVDYVYTAQ